MTFPHHLNLQVIIRLFNMPNVITVTVPPISFLLDHTYSGTELTSWNTSVCA